VAVSGAGSAAWLLAGRRRCRAAGRPHDAAGADGGGPRRGGGGRRGRTAGGWRGRTTVGGRPRRGGGGGRRGRTARALGRLAPEADGGGLGGRPAGAEGGGGWPASTAWWPARGDGRERARQGLAATAADERLAARAGLRERKTENRGRTQFLMVNFRRPRQVAAAAAETGGRRN
jgi:hypothetical protein